MEVHNKAAMPKEKKDEYQKKEEEEEKHEVDGAIGQVKESTSTLSSGPRPEQDPDPGPDQSRRGATRGAAISVPGCASCRVRRGA